MKLNITCTLSVIIIYAVVHCLHLPCMYTTSTILSHFDRYHIQRTIQGLSILSSKRPLVVGML